MKDTISGADSRLRKSPLRAEAMPRLARHLVSDPGLPGTHRGKGKLAAADLRQMTVSEFTAVAERQTKGRF